MTIPRLPKRTRQLDRTSYIVGAETQAHRLHTNSGMTANLVASDIAFEAVPSTPTAKMPFACRLAHAWVLLSPSDAQVDEIRKLVTWGRGAQGEMGAKLTDICDRVCPRCWTGENRMAMYIASLRRARGMKDADDKR